MSDATSRSLHTHWASMNKRKRSEGQDPNHRAGKTVQEGDTVILTVGDKQMFAKATKQR